MTAIVRIWGLGFESHAARNLTVQPTSTPKAPLAYRRRADRSCWLCGRLRRGGVQPARRPVLREEPPMPVKCVTGGLLFRTSNDLDWHIREEHLQERRRRPRARPSRPPRPWSVAPTRPTGRRHPRRGGYELGAT